MHIHLQSDRPYPIIFHTLVGRDDKIVPLSGIDDKRLHSHWLEFISEMVMVQKNHGLYIFVSEKYSQSNKI